MRVFLAARLDDELRRQLASIQHELREQLESSSGLTRLTWVKPEAAHLTFKFLAEFSAASVEPLREELAGLVGECPAFEIPLSRLGAFPRPQAPRTLWFGPEDRWDKTRDSQHALALVAAINRACAAFGAPPDPHPWRPHLTLARVREGERDVGRTLAGGSLFARDFGVGTLRVDQVTLMQSDLLPEGPRHTARWVVTLPQ